MKLIRAYISLYVRKSVLLSPLEPFDKIESGGYRRCKILTVDLPRVNKQGMEILFSKFRVEIAESRKNKKYKVMMRNQQRIANISSSLSLPNSLYLSLFISPSIYTSLSLTLYLQSLSLFLDISLPLSLSH